LKGVLPDSSISVVDYDAFLQFKTGSRSKARDFGMRENVAVGADGEVVDIPFRDHIAIAFAPKQMITNPSGASWKNAVGLQIVAMVYIQEQFAIRTE